MLQDSSSFWLSNHVTVNYGFLLVVIEAFCWQQGNIKDLFIYLPFFFFTQVGLTMQKIKSLMARQVRKKHAFIQGPAGRLYLAANLANWLIWQLIVWHLTGGVIRDKLSIFT